MWLMSLVAQSLWAFQESIHDGSADRALVQRSTHSVWMDPNSNDGRVKSDNLDAKSSLDVSDRLSSVTTPKKRTPSYWWQNFWSSFADMFGWLFRSWAIILLIALALVIAVAAYAIISNSTNLPYGRTRRGAALSKEREDAKIQDLPFEIEQSSLGLLEQASRYRAAGEYSKAIVYLYSHLLVQLDGARFIRLAKGKTNRTYLREIRDRNGLRGYVAQTVDAFEFAFFGKHPLSKESFESLWEKLPSFETTIAEAQQPSSETLMSNAGGVS
jgi:hypothetical protein